jgi:hypothetical protein
LFAAGLREGFSSVIVMGLLGIAVAWSSLAQSIFYSTDPHVHVKT